MAATKTWVVLAVTDLYPVMVPEQIRTVLTKEANGPDDPLNHFPFTSAMQMIADEVRSAIASNPRYALSATAYAVPPELKRTTAYLILDQLRGYFSPATGLTEAQVENVKDAKATLQMVRNTWQSWQGTGENKTFVISAPSDPETEPAQTVQPAAAVISTRPVYGDDNDRVVSRETLSGLI